MSYRYILHIIYIICILHIQPIIFLQEMRKNIDIDDTTLIKLKLISAFEDLSVKALMERAVRFFVEQKEKERYESLTDDEKEDIGLLALMSQADMNDLVSRDEIMDILDSE